LRETRNARGTPRCGNYDARDALLPNMTLLEAHSRPLAVMRHGLNASSFENLDSFFPANLAKQRIQHGAGKSETG
jgi:hypothetical protein